jgi:hypothetical protein
MSERIVNDPSLHGWVFENGKWVWNAASGGGAGAGMVISETEPTDRVEGMQWLNPINGLVLFWDDEKWLQMPGGVDGADGTNGTDGADGKGFTAGSYDDSTGVVTFDSDDGLGFATGDLRGADGSGLDEDGNLVIGNFTIGMNGDSLDFKVGGVSVARIGPEGKIYAKDDITGFWGS